MTTSNNTLEIGCFYPVNGEVMKFTGFRADEDKTVYSFESWRGYNSYLDRYNTVEAEEAQFSKMADWLRERCRKNGTRLCQGEQLDAIARCKVTDIAVINDWNENKQTTSEAIAYSMRD